jgi:hypothetical protein
MTVTSVKRKLGHGSFLYLPSQGWATCPSFVFGAPGRASPLYLRSEPPSRSDVSKGDPLVDPNPAQGSHEAWRPFFEASRERDATAGRSRRVPLAISPWRFHLGESHLGDGELVFGRARLLRRGFRLEVKTIVLGSHFAIRRCVNPADPP